MISTTSVSQESPLFKPVSASTVNSKLVQTVLPSSKHSYYRQIEVERLISFFQRYKPQYVRQHIYDRRILKADPDLAQLM